VYRLPVSSIDETRGYDPVAALQAVAQTHGGSVPRARLMYQAPFPSVVVSARNL